MAERIDEGIAAPDPGTRSTGLGGQEVVRQQLADPGGTEPVGCPFGELFGGQHIDMPLSDMSNEGGRVGPTQPEIGLQDHQSCALRWRRRGHE